METVMRKEEMIYTCANLHNKIELYMQSYFENKLMLQQLVLTPNRLYS